MVVRIEMTEKVNLKDYTLIEGFPGIGLVGTIASGYIVDKLKMKPIGYIYSDGFPPMTTIHKGRPYFPARFYVDPKNKIVVLLAEFIIPSKIVYELSNVLLEMVKKQKIKKIISLAGMKTPKKEMVKEIYGIASTPEVGKFLEKNKIKLIKEGITTGVSGVLISMCAAQGISAMSLLAESKYGYPDPNAAAKLIEKLNEFQKLTIDTTELKKEAGKVEEKMKQLIKRMPSKAGDGIAPGTPGYPSMYE